MRVPGTVISGFKSVAFCDWQAYADICNMKANVRRSHFYEASTELVVNHVDRWVEIITEGIRDDNEWIELIEISERIEALIFDIMTDLGFGKAFRIKEPGDNPYKCVLNRIAAYVRSNDLSLCNMSRVPFLGSLLWLKPRGLDHLFDIISPPVARLYNKFVRDSFLAEARDPNTEPLVYNNDGLQAKGRRRDMDLSILYDIVHGPKLQSCTYWRACIDEAMRPAPPGLSELPREVLPGGLQIKGEFYPAGTIIGTSPWANSRDTDVYEDVEAFRPERWIADESRGVTKFSLRLARMLYRLDVRRAPSSPKHLQLIDAYISLRRSPEAQFRKRWFNI
ncbi:benzoate 4-monooxygenase cytochrome P450 [Nemania abortiva]|nr:benzoate 4-monooxygenase cytochrome P450 [Nemania abortiva]